MISLTTLKNLRLPTETHPNSFPNVLFARASPSRILIGQLPPRSHRRSAESLFMKSVTIEDFKIAFLPQTVHPV